MSLPEPFYVNREKKIVIYCGDSRIIMESIPRDRISLVLTDPPYGIDQDPQKFDKTREFEKVKDDDVPFNPHQVLNMCPRAVLWGANNFAHEISPSLYINPDVQPFGGWLVWDKTIDNDVKVKISHGELAWTNCFRGIRIFRHLWSGSYRASEPGFHVHPTQKPVMLMRWVLEMFTKPGDLVFDPYMGSGPVAQACYELGRAYVGIEWKEDYCEIAKKRVAVSNLWEEADS